MQNNNLFINLLTDKRFKILRHLALLGFTFSISIGFIWHMVEEGILKTSIQTYGGLLLFILIFMVSCYINIYILTPRLLLKNKWILYFCSLLGIVAFVIIAIILFEVVFFKQEIPSGDEKGFYFLSVIINLLSSTLSIFLLLSGTTTFVLFKYWILDMQHAKELESVTMQLELKLLENQINPHFLFNMLNNANIMIKKDPDVAIHIIGRLEDMLRYLMNDSANERVYLKEEIAFLNDFLELEKTRRDFFTYKTIVEGNANDIQIPPLLFISFVENAVKHNLDSHAASFVTLSFNIKRDKLVFICENSIPLKPTNKQEGGIGLTNIKRRLNLLYNNNYSLEQTRTNSTYNVKLEFRL